MIQLKESQAISIRNFRNKFKTAKTAEEEWVSNVRPLTSSEKEHLAKLGEKFEKELFHTSTKA